MAGVHVCMRAWVCAQSHLTLCDPMDCSLLGSSVHGIFQARRILDWLPFPPPGDGPNPGIEPLSQTSYIGRQILYPWVTWEAPVGVDEDTNIKLT